MNLKNCFSFRLTIYFFFCGFKKIGWIKIDPVTKREKLCPFIGKIEEKIEPNGVLREGRNAWHRKQAFANLDKQLKVSSGGLLLCWEEKSVFRGLSHYSYIPGGVEELQKCRLVIWQISCRLLIFVYSCMWKFGWWRVLLRWRTSVEPILLLEHLPWPLPLLRLGRKQLLGVDFESTCLLGCQDERKKLEEAVRVLEMSRQAHRKEISRVISTKSENKYHVWLAKSRSTYYLLHDCEDARTREQALTWREVCKIFFLERKQSYSKIKKSGKVPKQCHFTIR